MRGKAFVMYGIDAHSELLRIFGNKPEGASTVLTWLGLCLMANERRATTFRAPIRAIAEKAALSYNTTAARLRDLENGGFVAIKPSSDPRSFDGSTYTLLHTVERRQSSPEQTPSQRVPPVARTGGRDEF